MKKNNRDVISIFSNFKKILEAKPSINTMFDEVRMMKFKVKPISGDISLLELKDNRLIETLWSLGKLDEVFQREFKRLTVSEKEVFFRIFDNLYQRFQNQLNTVHLGREKKPNTPQILEMEIFKEAPVKKKAN